MTIALSICAYVITGTITGTVCFRNIYPNLILRRDDAQGVSFLAAILWPITVIIILTNHALDVSIGTDKKRSSRATRKLEIELKRERLKTAIAEERLTQVELTELELKSMLE